MPPKTLAQTADRHLLYERSVQVPEADILFLDREFKKRSGRPPLTLREDFCGTAFFSSEWVKSRPDRRATGVDLDAETLAWADAHNLQALGAARDRIRLVREDVRTRWREKVDLQVAFNFSYCCFHERKDLLAYFKKACASIADDGLFSLDIHGGAEAVDELEERKKIAEPPAGYQGTRYVWSQGPFDPLSHKTLRWIGFEFRDGSKIKKAFTYDWRIWTAPELRDALMEAGFAEVDFYWEGTDHKTGQGNGVYRKAKAGENDPSWICYICAWKAPRQRP